MKTLRSMLAAAAAILSLAASVRAASTDAPHFGGEWRISYHDEIVGDVVGRAVVPGDEQSCDVTLWDPRAPETSHRLRGSEVKREGNTIKFTLRGKSPYSDRKAADTTAMPQLTVATSATEISAQIDAVSTTAAIQKRGPVDLDLVDLTLEFAGESKDLTGHWTYRADLDTERDRDGFGRVGTYAETTEDGKRLGRQTGTETWEHVRPVICGVVVLDGPRPNSELRTSAPTAGDLRRTLFVYGWNLPKTFGDLLDRPVPASGETGTPIDYRVSALKNSANSLDSERIQTGFERACAGLPDEAKSVVRQMDTMLLSADFANGTSAGVKRFRLGEAEGAWNLELDATAVLSFAHKNKDGRTVAANEFRLPELVIVQVQTSYTMPVAEIPIQIDSVIAGKREHAVEVKAKRLADQPRVYQTPPIQLYEDGRAELSGATSGIPSVAAKGNGRLVASIGKPAAVRADPPEAVAAILLPSDTRGLWNFALVRAANCHPEILAKVDLAHMAHVESVKITNWIITEAGTRSITLTCGDHAALLLLRDTFVEMMEEVKAQQLLSVDNDAAIETTRAKLRTYLDDSNSPYQRLKVTPPVGYRTVAGEVMSTIIHAGGLGPDMGLPLSFAFSDSFLQKQFGSNRAAAEAWTRQSIVEAVKLYNDSVDATIAKAKGLADSDTDGLMDLVAYGFEPVKARLLPRLQRLEENNQDGKYTFDWQPDQLARMTVANIQSPIDAVRAQRDLSKIDTQVALAAVSILTGGASAAAAASGSVRAIMATAAAEVVTTTGMAAHGVITSLAELRANWAEQNFALGASLLVGVGRYDQAVENDPGFWSTLGGVAVNVGLSSYAAMQSASRVRTIYNLKRIESGGATALKGLAENQRQEFIAMAEEARAQRCVQGQGSLTEMQRRTLAAWEKVADECGIPLRGVCFIAGTAVATVDGPRAIEYVHVGDRVLTPTDAIGETEVDPSTWRKVTLRLPNEDAPSDLLAIEWLRPESWVLANRCVAGARIWVDLEPMGLRGWAGIVAVEPCPRIGRSLGRVVLATIAHQNGHVGRLTVGGATLQLTDVHRVYSLSRNAWISAAAVQPGESLKTKPGAATVTATQSAFGIYRVYNLEVEGDHCFFVGDAEVLSHNSEQCIGAANAGVVWGKGIEGQGMPWEDYLAKKIPGGGKIYSPGGSGTRLPPNFKTFDFYDPVTKTATSAKTLEMQSLKNGVMVPKTAEDIVASLKGNIDAAANFSEYSLSGVDLNAPMIKNKELQVAIPLNTSQAQLDAMSEAVLYGQRHGVKVTISYAY